MRRTPLLRAAAAAALLSACSGRTTGTAPARMLEFNSEVSGQLTPQDPRFTDNTAYQTWQFHGTAGDMVQIDVMSAVFDAYAILEDDAGHELAHDDDSGGGTDPRIRFALPATANYRIVAKAFRPGAYGGYRLRLSRLGAMAPGGNGATIQRGQLMAGRLTSNDSRMSDHSLYHLYNYEGHAGEAITIDVMSSDFDAFAILQDPQGNEVARDDDSGGGTNARIITTLRQTGIYRIFVNTFRAGDSGAYTLWVH